MTRRTGSHSKKHIYFYTHIQGSNNKTRILETKAKHACSCFVKHAGRNKDTSKAKHDNRLLLLFTSTYTVLLARTRRHNFHTNKQRKDHPHRQGGQTGLLGSLWHGTWQTERVPRDRAGYLHPRDALGCEPRRPVPTAASVAAVELGPCQGEVIRAPAGNTLRGTNGSFMLS